MAISSPFVRSPCCASPPRPTPSGRNGPAARASSRSSQQRLTVVSYLRGATSPSGRRSLDRVPGARLLSPGCLACSATSGDRRWDTWPCSSRSAGRPTQPSTSRTAPSPAEDCAQNDRCRQPEDELSDRARNPQERRAWVQGPGVVPRESSVGGRLRDARRPLARAGPRGDRRRRARRHTAVGLLQRVGC
jgi:hypothetical protein